MAFRSGLIIYFPVRPSLENGKTAITKPASPTSVGFLGLCEALSLQPLKTIAIPLRQS